ncbi:hypothetical protein M440DRAFT_1399083 [Trichoderma longibrachiatum ATCC 18648]|uniref:Uncharacterized protein n=1 Tax=Trichoderma longibrachiatum ATCC 18648 TaxID=983965 RepID=A0A2T4CE35_TRILO|nr:hypothetical protein M440DRAFT_1399083 [Trichoderma longibrachiatum ATCC 18648]
MPNRVEKSRSKPRSTQSRHSHADFAWLLRVVASVLIVVYWVGGATVHSSRCRLELKRLEHQEELAEEALIAQQKKLNKLLAEQQRRRDKALARLLRLRKLRRMLRDRRVEMVNRGLNAEEIEESDRREEEERQAELNRVQRKEAQLLHKVQAIDNAVADFPSFDLSAFLASNEIPSGSSRNVQGSQ